MNSINTGLFGEYYVAAMMHLRGWTGVLTLKNYPNVALWRTAPIAVPAQQ